MKNLWRISIEYILMKNDEVTVTLEFTYSITWTSYEYLANSSTDKMHI